ncbi:MAG: hypothetical protein HKO57_12515, partial [Akkermansiaceae bacterium]|nr:hypothetical protein [Akkermansiaceae bacterium]
AWDDGKLRIALWDELMEVRMEARPEDEWIKVRAAQGQPATIPVYTLRVDPADTSVNAEHLRSNEYELRVGPRNGEAAVLVYSPQFTPRARE